MEIYIVNVGAKKHHDLMRQLNLRLLHVAYDWRNPIEGIPYAVDNGAYHYWNNHKDFDGHRFQKTLKKVNKLSIDPDFIVCPDIVAGGISSLEFSLKWADLEPREDYYLAVQDGMSEKIVQNSLNGFKGLMVGGTMDWKLKTSEQWVKLAHKNKLTCHIGRVGTFKRLLWARRIGADSVDSSTFAHAPNLNRYKRIVAMLHQTCFDGFCTGDKFICRSCALNKICEGDI